MLKLFLKLPSLYAIENVNGGVQCAIDLSKVKLDKTSLGDIWLAMYYNKTVCIGMNLKYHSPNGSCNNLKRSYSGKATTAHKRLLFSNYIDSFYEVYKDSFSSYRPSPRRLSVEFVKDEDSPDDFKTMAMAYWTIFVGHDLSHRPISRMMNSNKSVSCCSNSWKEPMPRDIYHELCLQVMIPEVSEDSFSSYRPSPRRLSVEFVKDEYSPDDFKTMAMAYWMIFVGHDLSHTAISRMMNSNNSVSCCNKNRMELRPGSIYHELCLQVVIPDEDPFFRNSICCMNYLCLGPAVRSDCTFGPKEQWKVALT
ncbi:uncharacterized protein LOC100571224 isoform X2 [Acyrthosiphon pisum]|uniref:Uncharacterized protein n=1 Tax=Acyrthosiphon pisum TaxID=7029 RepID=A0A8R2NK57_ACYPI|nr:uncharacterized protein LOC100571224 isoform X2 [Acyrthosiphon pisum]